MSDTSTTATEAQPQDDAVATMGDTEYVPRQIVDDDLGGLSLDEAYEQSMVTVEDGQIVSGTVVKVDRDEVLLDIGYKSEGVIPSRELSIRNEVDPSEVVAIGDEVEALVLQKEDKEGRLILSKKRAQYERAWGTIEKIKEEDGVVSGPVIEVVKGGLILDIGLRGFLPASLVELRRVRAPGDVAVPSANDAATDSSRSRTTTRAHRRGAHRTRRTTRSPHETSRPTSPRPDRGPHDGRSSRTGRRRGRRTSGGTPRHWHRAAALPVDRSPTLASQTSSFPPKPKCCTKPDRLEPARPSSSPARTLRTRRLLLSASTYARRRLP